MYSSERLSAKMIFSKQNKQSIILYGSTLLGMSIGVLNSIINTRALIPELYGDFRYIQNIISFVSSLLLVGFFTSGSRLLALSEDGTYKKNIRGIMCLILVLTIAVVMLTMTVLYFISVAQAKANLSRLYLISIPLCGNVLMLNYINTTAQGDNHIERIAVARLVPPALYCLVAYLFYRKFGATPARMLILFNGLAILILSMVIASTRPSFRKLKVSFKILNKENRRYGFNVYLGSLVGVSTTYIAGITLGQFYNTNVNVGYYTLALTIASPLSTLPTIIGTTYFKRFATQKKISKKIMNGSVVITLSSGVLFIIFIKYIVSFLYDDNYVSVSVYAAWLAFGSCFHGLGDLINRFLGAHGQGKQIRNAAFACGTILTIGSIVLVYFWGIRGAICTIIASDLVYFLTLRLYYSRFIHSINKRRL